MKPSIAAIVPAYNVERYITSAIDSLLSQTVKFDEIIVIDDGSEDNTLNILQSYNADGRIKLISQNNSGQGIARNNGLCVARSEYCYFFDSDDVLDTNACETMKSELISNNLPDIFLFEGRSFVDGKQQVQVFYPSYRRPFEGLFICREDFFTAINKSSDLSCSPCLYVSKRRLWISNDLNFNCHYHEDEEVFYKLLLVSDLFLVRHLTLFNRRVRHDSTMTMKKNSKHVNGHKANLITLHSIFISNFYPTPINRALRKRISKFTSIYYLTCLRANSSVDWLVIINSFKYVKSINLLVRLLYVRVGFVIHSLIKRIN